MSNHYNQLVRVPGVVKLNDGQLLKRMKSYYGEESLEVLLYERALERGEEAVAPLRTRYLKRMGNISDSGPRQKGIDQPGAAVGNP